MKPLLVVILATVTAGVMALLRQLATELESIPEGYEDENGFHFRR